MSSLIIEVCKIKEIEKHPNADRLEIATVKGWNVIIQTGQYKVGDIVVFIPPDSILPNDLIEEYKLDYLKKDGRVGTVKLRGVISQGLVLPVPETILSWKIGDDVSTYLGITKYEVPEPVYSTRGGNQVSRKKLNSLFSKYTEIENIKNYDTVFGDGEVVVITEKLHGANFRAGNIPISINENAPFLYKLVTWIKKLFGQKYEFVYGSHMVQKSGNFGAQHYYGEDVWGQIAKKYDLANILPKGYIFYGEIIGKKIQDLDYDLDDQELYIFDIKNVETGEYLDWDLVTGWCDKLWLASVPQLYFGDFSKEVLNAHTTGSSMLCKTQMREGIVIKPVEESRDRMIGRKILKSINPEYLLRKGGTEFK